MDIRNICLDPFCVRRRKYNTDARFEWGSIIFDVSTLFRSVIPFPAVWWGDVINTWVVCINPWIHDGNPFQKHGLLWMGCRDQVTHGWSWGLFAIKNGYWWMKHVIFHSYIFNNWECKNERYQIDSHQWLLAFKFWVSATVLSNTVFWATELITDMPKRGWFSVEDGPPFSH